MSAPAIRIAGFFVAVGCLGGLALTGKAVSRSASLGPPRAAQDIGSVGLTGTQSCSTFACHGSPFPVDAMVQQCEFNIWLDDKHATSYSVLTTARSKQIIRNLGKGWKPAHQEERCLVCHTNPVLAAEKLNGNEDAEKERSFGVSCETCHGPAANWRNLHYQKEWKAAYPESDKDSAMRKWKEKGLFPTGSLVEKARLCAGCHVGSGPTEFMGQQIAARDCNHDIMAGGHPRLNFELDIYQTVTPHHWSKKRDESKPADFDARSWAVGQMLVAEAGLDLLKHRASKKDAPWPEFTEYDCYACHHDFRWGQATKIWRQSPEHYEKRTPGSLPYGTWSLALMGVPSVPASGVFPTDLGKQLQPLRDLMRKPLPPRDLVAAEAGKLSDAMKKMHQSATFDKDQLRQLMRDVASQGKGVADLSWDSAAQVYLAVAALNQSYQRSLGSAADGKARELDAAVRKLSDMLDFPKSYDSPFNLFDPVRAKDGPPSKRLDELLKLLGP